MSRKDVKNKLVYRLRNFGYRVDSKSREVFLTEDDKHHNLVDRLINEYGFSVATGFYIDGVKGRVFILSGGTSSTYSHSVGNMSRVVARLRDQGYMPINAEMLDGNRKKVDALTRCDVVYCCKNWLDDNDNMTLLSLAKFLDKKVVFE